MIRSNDLPTPVRQGNLWVLPNGRTFPVIEGGADDGPPGIVVDVPTAKEDEEKYFTTEQVEAIRKQEKDKIYGEIDKGKAALAEQKARNDALEAQMAAFQTDVDAAAALKAEEAAAAEAERIAHEQEAMTAKELLAVKEADFASRLEESENKWATQFADLQDKAQQQEQVIAKERAFQVLEGYKAQRIAEESENLMPHLVDLIGGSTEEEIETSIMAVAAKTSAIMEDMQLGQAQQPGPRAVPTTGGSPTGPLENQTAQQQLSGDDIAAMTMEQYAALRPQLLAQTRPTG